MELAVRKIDSENSYYQFPNDHFYYDRNPHPSIEEMICISKEIDIPYIKVFHRFSELRLKNGEKCLKNDPCIRVFKFINLSESFDGILGSRSMKVMRDEFEFVGGIKSLPVESLHLIMQETNLPESLVMKQFEKWKNESLIQMNQSELISQKRSELIDVDFEEEQFEKLHFSDVSLERSYSESDCRTATIRQTASGEKINDADESDENVLRLLDSSPNQFPLDLEFFNKNRHPSIQDMINISMEIDVPYEIIIKRFFELRMVTREKCRINDSCRKIFQFLNGQENVLLDKNSEKLLEDEFSKIKKFGRHQITGHFHLIMDKVCLPSHIIRKKYAEWYEKRAVQNNINRKIHRHFLRSEFEKNTVLSKRRAIELGFKCGLQWTSVNRFFSIQRKLERDNKTRKIPSYMLA